MVLIALLIGAILVVAAIRGTQGALFSALSTDVPEFVVWAAAIVAIGAIGFIPGLKPVSRALLGLILVVIVLHNYQTILAGFNASWQAPAASSGATTSTATVNQATTAAPSTGATPDTTSAPPLTINVPVSDATTSFGSVPSE